MREMKKERNTIRRQPIEKNAFAFEKLVKRNKANGSIEFPLKYRETRIIYI